MARRTTFAAASLAAMLSLSACGTTTQVNDEPGGSSPTDDAPFVVAADGEILVGCGGDAGWEASVTPEGIPGVLSADEATQIFQGILDDPGVTGHEARLTLFRNGVDVEWRVLRNADGHLTLGIGGWTAHGPANGTYLLALEPEGGELQLGAWWDCRPAPVLKGGHDRVEVKAYRGDPKSTRLMVEVTELECAAGRHPGPFLHEPLVVESAEAVTIYWTSDPPTGPAQTCVGNPSVERAVDLEEPLGTRTVYDGLSHSPAPVRPR